MPPPQVGDDALLHVREVDPLKTLRVGVPFVEFGQAAVEAVQVADPLEDPPVGRVLQEVPLKPGIVTPLRPLPELAPHEEEFLARVCEHVPQEEAEVCPLLPLIAGHLPDKRTLSVDDLIVREGEDVALTECIPDAEREKVEPVASGRPGRARSSSGCHASSPCSTSGQTRAPRSRSGRSPPARRSPPRR